MYYKVFRIDNVSISAEESEYDMAPGRDIILRDLDAGGSTPEMAMSFVRMDKNDEYLVLPIYTGE